MARETRKKNPLGLVYFQPAAFPLYDVADIAAVQALYRGEATPEMQKRAIKWIVQYLCALPELGCGNGNDALNFHEGRRFVGKCLLNIDRVSLQDVREYINDLSSSLPKE